MQNIDTLVHDIMELEPSLKGKEAQVRKAVEALAKSRPDVPDAQAFLAELRKTLMNEFGAKAAASSKDTADHEPWMLAVHNFLTRRAAYTAGGVLAVLLLAVIVVAPRGPSSPTNLAVVGGSGGMHVTKVAAASFGSLAVAGGPSAADASISARPEAAPMARTQSGGGFAGGLGGGGGIAASTMAAPAPMMDAKMIAPGEPGSMPYQPTVFVYEYDGAPLELSDANLDVLRRIKGNGVNADAVRNLVPGGIAGSLSDMKLQSFSGFEDREYGLSVYADFLEETVSLSQNWNKWPHPENQCRDQACSEQYRIKESDMPSDDAAIAMAKQFVAERGISIDGYGEPTVVNQWKRWYLAMAAADRIAYWFPEQTMVTFPMQASGQRVVDESGQAYGMTVNVNARFKRADGAYGIQTRNYESASYEATTDAKEILDIASRGGVNAWMPEGDVKRVSVKLDTPERVLVRMFQYGGDGIGKELLVPALRFPVKDAQTQTEIGMPQEAVVVPLVKELLKRPEFGGGPIMYMKDGSASSVAPSAGVAVPVPAPAIEPAAEPRTMVAPR